MVQLDAVAPFAAAKKNRQKNASLHKGFGKAPPTLEDTLATFKSAVPPPPHDTIPCPCGQFSGKSYAECCGPYHDGVEQPVSPLAVLRSRYSAFCWRNIAYIIQTTHSTCRDFRENKVAWAKDLDRNGMFDSYDFVGLTVLGDEEISNENEGFVNFEVRLRANQAVDQIEGQIQVIKERSKFLRDPETKVWSYASGDVSTSVGELEDIKLNS